MERPNINWYRRPRRFHLARPPRTTQFLFTGFSYIMFVTPARSAKRRLMFSTGPGPSKRGRAFSGGRSTAPFRSANKRRVGGVRSGGTLTQQVKNLQKVVREILPEIKNIGIDLAQTNFTSSGTVTHLTAIPQGVTEVTRIGEDVNLRELFIRGNISNMLTTGTTSTPVYYRFALIFDKQQINDTTPAVTDIFDSADPVRALPNNSNSERFKFVWVSPLICNNSVLNGNQMGVVTHTWRGLLKVGYNGANATDIAKNGAYFVILTSDSSNTVDFTGVARLMFTDT